MSASVYQDIANESMESEASSEGNVFFYLRFVEGRGKSLHVYIAQLEHLLSETEKAISFKTNLLRWVINLYFNNQHRP